MRFLTFPNNCRLQYVFTGKFTAPSRDWKHQLFDLNEFELIVMTEGVLYLSYGNDEFTVEKGNYLLLPPSDAYRNGFRESYCSFYWLHFSVSEFWQGTTPPPDGDSPSIPQIGTVPRPEKMAVLMKQLQDEVKNNYPVICLDAMTTSVVMELYGQLSLRAASSSRKISSREQIYSDILDYIQLNIAKNIKAADVAAQFGYNVKYLSHIFSSFAGMTLKQFILARKIEHANFLLNDTNLSVTEIATSVGFSDSHNFSRCYKRVTGLSPTEYRNTFFKRMLYDK